MDIPQNILIGGLAENATKHLFLSWGWATAKDEQDIGYDLFVQPDSEQFKGQRFLVQVKGTLIENRGHVTAPVRKKRLLQYLDNPHPIFIVRVTADGALYWLHAQPWARSNRARLKGEGKISVRMDVNQRLEDRESFVAYLAKIFTPIEARQGALAELAQKRGELLSSIDPRLSVGVSTEAGSETYTFLAAEGGFSVPIEMVLRDAADAAAMDEAVKYGLPVSLDLDGMKVSGSPLFSELELDQLQPAKVDIIRNGRVGVVTLFAGLRPFVSAPSMEISVDAYYGHGGATMRSRRLTPAVFELRVDLSEGQPKTNFSLGLDLAQLCNGPLALAPSLAEFGAWAGASLEAGGFILGTSYSRHRTTWPLSSRDSRTTKVLRLIRDLHRLQQIARHFDSDFSIDDETQLKAEDVKTIEIFYDVLNGEKVVVGMPELRVDGIEHFPDHEADGAYFCKVNHSIRVADTVIGTIPVHIELLNYERIDNTSDGTMLLRSQVGSSATIEEADSAEHDLHLVNGQGPLSS